MPLWSDNFNRTNGPLGANWVDKVSTFAISANTAVPTGRSIAVAGPVTAPGAASAEADVSIGSNSGAAMAVAVKVNNTGSLYYAAMVYTSGSDLIVWLLHNGGGGDSVVATYTITGGAAATGRIRCEYVSGVVRAYYNGTLYCTYNNSALAANQYVGLYGRNTGQAADNFTGTGDGAPRLIVSPSRVGTLNGDTPLTIMGVGITWGALPSLSVGAGAIGSLFLTSTSTVAALFTPPATAQTVTLTDSTDGLSATITVVEGTGSDNGGDLGGGASGCRLTEGGAATINRAETIPGDETVLTDLSVVIPGALGANDLTLLSAISDLWKAHYSTWAGEPPETTTALGYVLWALLNGGSDPAVGPWLNVDPAPLGETLGIVRRQFYDAVEEAYVGTPDLLAAIQAVGGADVSQVLADIGIQGQGTWTSLLQVLLGMWGVGAHTLTTIGDDIDAVRGLSNRTLDDVIAAIPGAVSLQPVLDAISAHDTHLTNSTTYIRNDIAGAVILLSAIQLGLGDLTTATTAITTTLDTLSDKVDALAEQVAAISGAPVWPGLDGVQLETPIAVTNAWTHTGACDGILLSIQVEMVKQPTLAVGPIKTYRSMGRVAFKTDSGEYEPWQPIPANTCLMMPKQMARSNGFIIGFYHVVDATVIPFTIMQPA